MDNVDIRSGGFSNTAANCVQPLRLLDTVRLTGWGKSMVRVSFIASHRPATALPTKNLPKTPTRSRNKEYCANGSCPEAVCTANKVVDTCTSNEHPKTEGVCETWLHTVLAMDAPKQQQSAIEIDFS